MSEATGIAYDSLRRFRDGEAGLSLKNAEKLMVFFGMRVVDREKR